MNILLDTQKLFNRKKLSQKIKDNRTCEIKIGELRLIPKGI